MSTVQNLSIEGQKEARRRAADAVWQRQQERLRLHRALAVALRKHERTLHAAAGEASASHREHTALAATLAALDAQLAAAEEAWREAEGTVRAARSAATGREAEAAASALASVARASGRTLADVEAALREHLHHVAGLGEEWDALTERLAEASRLGREVGLMVRDARLMTPTALTLLTLQHNGYRLREAQTHEGLIAYFVSADGTHEVAVRHRPPEQTALTQALDQEVAFQIQFETFGQEGEACLDVLEDFVLGVEEAALGRVTYAGPGQYPKRDGDSGIPIPVRETAGPSRLPQRGTGEREQR